MADFEEKICGRFRDKKFMTGFEENGILERGGGEELA